MAKGKTNQPVTYFVHRSLLDHPCIVALSVKGHTVVTFEQDGIVLAPQACRMTRAMLDSKYGEQVLELATKGARAALRATQTKAPVDEADSDSLPERPSSGVDMGDATTVGCPASEGGV